MIVLLQSAHTFAFLDAMTSATPVDACHFRFQVHVNTPQVLNLRHQERDALFSLQELAFLCTEHFSLTPDYINQLPFSECRYNGLQNNQLYMSDKVGHNPNQPYWHLLCCQMIHEENSCIYGQPTAETFSMNNNPPEKVIKCKYHR